MVLSAAALLSGSGAQRSSRDRRARRRARQEKGQTEVFQGFQAVADRVDRREQQERDRGGPTGGGARGQHGQGARIAQPREEQLPDRDSRSHRARGTQQARQLGLEEVAPGQRRQPAHQQLEHDVGETTERSTPTAAPAMPHRESHATPTTASTTARACRFTSDQMYPCACVALLA